MKLFQTINYAAFTGSCPWQNQIQAKYLVMSIVTISTIFQTIFVSMILLLSKGWGYARSNLSRDDLSSVTIAMGGVYLVYSAYFVASNIEGLTYFVQVLLNSLYVILLTVVLKNAFDTRQLLKEQQRVIYDNNVEPLMAAINLKVKTVNRFIAITITYFTFAIIVNGLIPAVQQATSGEFTNKHWDEIFQQYFDLGTILALLFVFRPRVWPDYFTIGLFNGED